MSNTVLPTDPMETRTALPAGSWLRKRAIVKGVLLAGLVMFLAEALRIFVGTNFHVVAKDRCYRSAQPTAQFLESVQRKHGIQSIINLRGENPDDGWYQEEKRAAENLGILLIDAGLWSSAQAPAEDFRIFVQAVHDAPEPILIHCANGNDRSGLASAVYFLMRTDKSLEVARGQLSLRFGHVAWSRASCLSRILDNYEAWLQEKGWQHSPDRFFDWGMNFYVEETLP